MPPSPNAATLGKFGDIPVSQYTGTATVTVPLYTIQSGDITLPISLDYHTSGIQLKQLAGWAGLGWTLSAGGVINHQLKDKDDLIGGTSTFPDIMTKGEMKITLQAGTTIPFALFQFFHEHPASAKVLNTTKEEQFDLSPFLGSIDGYDTEYDIFSYNFCGKSGRFIITRSGQVILEKQDDIIVTPPAGGNQFKIKDSQGFIYSFESYELASMDPLVGSFKTSWYLSRIESLKGNAIDFIYQPTTSLSLSQDLWSDNFGSGAPSSHTIRTTSFPNVLILTRINFAEGYVDLPTDALRTDYTGLRTTGLKVFLNGVVTPVKEFEFKYTYFDAQRMRLDEVVEKAGTSKLSPYRFSYHNDGIFGLTDLNAYSFDHWGYFNGKGNITSIPEFRGGPIVVGASGSSGDVTNLTYPFLTLAGANRSPDPDKAKLFSLKEVQYPTGGKTVFETEGNTYFVDFTGQSNSEGTSGPAPEFVHTSDAVTFAPGDPGEDLTGSLSSMIPSGSKNVTVTASFICYGSDLCTSAKSLSYGSIYLELDGNTRDIAGTFVSCGYGGTQSICKATDLIATLTSNYKFHISNNVTAAHNFFQIKLAVEWDQPANSVPVGTPVTKNYAAAGGLRVKRVSDYDSDGKLTKSQRFEYHYWKDTNADGVLEECSYGKSFSKSHYFRSYIQSQTQMEVSALSHNVFQRFSNSVIPPGISVGYDKVIESVTYTDASTDDFNGKTIYSFFNKSDSIYSYNVSTGDAYGDSRPPGIANLSHKLNGSLIAKKVFKKAGADLQPALETKTEYSKSLLNNYFSFQHDYIEVNELVTVWGVFHRYILFV